MIKILNFTVVKLLYFDIFYSVLYIFNFVLWPNSLIFALASFSGCCIIYCFSYVSNSYASKTFLIKKILRKTFPVINVIVLHCQRRIQSLIKHLRLVDNFIHKVEKLTFMIRVWVTLCFSYKNRKKTFAYKNRVQKI